MAEDVIELVDRIISEGPIGMGRAASLIGEFKAGKRTHPSTVTRWVTQGVRLAGGRVVRLEAVRVAGRLVTSKQAVVRFVAAQQTSSETAPDTHTVHLRRSTTQRRKASEAAAAELQAAGI